MIRYLAVINQGILDGCWKLQFLEDLPFEVIGPEIIFDGEKWVEVNPGEWDKWIKRMNKMIEVKNKLFSL